MIDTDTQARRARRDAQRNLERVLAAAHELFAERGDDVTMEEVARRAGVGIGTIYRRFPSKEHLFAAVSHAACADTRHCLVAAVTAEAGPLQQLRALALVQYQHALGQAPLLGMRQPPEATCAGAALEQQQLYETLHALLSQIIADGQRQGLLAPGSPAGLATLCLELVSPRTFAHLAHTLGCDAEEVVEHVLRFMLAGLGAR